jgi:hypothetical protein
VEIGSFTIEFPEQASAEKRQYRLDRLQDYGALSRHVNNVLFTSLFDAAAGMLFQLLEDTERVLLIRHPVPKYRGTSQKNAQSSRNLVTLV